MPMPDEKEKFTELDSVISLEWKRPYSLYLKSKQIYSTMVLKN